MPVGALVELARRAEVSLSEAIEAWEKAKEKVGPKRDDDKYWGIVMKITKDQLGIEEEIKYDEFYWMNLREAKRTNGQKILKWLESKAINKDVDIDLDEKIAERFGVSELNAGRMIEVYVRYKAGAFNDKKAIKEIERLI